MPRVHNSNNFLIDGNILMSEKRDPKLGYSANKANVVKILSLNLNRFNENDSEENVGFHHFYILLHILETIMIDFN